MASCKIIKEEGFWTIEMPVTASTALDDGETAKLASSKVSPVSAATDDATFIGISEGVALAAQTTARVPIARVCVLQVAGQSSATLAMGAGLLWSAKLTFAADVGANTIAWVNDDSGSARTSWQVLVDVPRLAKLFVAASA